MNLSVLVVCLNEAKRLGPLLDAVKAENPTEVLVADGGSTDNSQELAQAKGAQLVLGAQGRALQFNLAAQQAQGDALLLLHGDCLPQPGWTRQIEQTLADPEISLGAFRFQTDGIGLKYRLLEQAVHWRSRGLGLPYGDQGFFLRRETFKRLGGFKELPLMEDLELVGRAKQLGKVVTVPLPLITSARRWETAGLWAVSWTNLRMLWGYTRGQDLNELKQVYHSLVERRKKN